MLKTILLGLALSGTAKATPAVDFLAYGDIRGHLEPCGCDPATDLGGIKRLGVALARERSVHPDALILDLGNNLPVSGDSSLKTPFLIGASATIDPNAVLLNVLEQERLDEIRAWQSHETRSFPTYVLSNARPGSLAAGVSRPSIAGKNWVILGYVNDKAIGAAVQPFSASLVGVWTQLLAKQPKANKILLFSGSDQDLRSIMATKLFNVIVSSNTSPMDTVPGVEEKQNEAKLVRSKDFPVNMVPLAGQGILRGGALQFDEAKPLSALLGSPEPAKQKDSAWLRTPTLVTWLDTTTATGDGPLKSVYDDYTKAARASFRNQSEARIKQLKDTPFAGAQACASCHPEQTRIYLKSQHAHAMATLQAKGKHEDAECVACHSLGSKVPGGFVSLAASPQFANVQCENCHGPRLAHTRDPAGTPKPKMAAATVCVACHNAQHSSAFNFSVYWPRIKH